MRLYFVFSASSSTLSPFFLLPNTAMFQCHVKSCHINKTLLNIPITVTVKIIIHGFVGPHGLQPTRVLCPWDSPGKNTGVGCHALLQGIFLTQGSNSHLLCLLYCRWILYPLSHWGSPIYSHLNLSVLLEIFKMRMNLKIFLK